jgi:hypothetical protein
MILTSRLTKYQMSLSSDEWRVTILHNQEIPCSHLGPETRHPEAVSFPQSLQARAWTDNECRHNVKSYITRPDVKQLIVSDYTGRPGVRSPAETKDFSCSFCVQTSCQAHPAFYPMGTGVPFPGDQARHGRDVDHSPPSTAETKYE